MDWGLRDRPARRVVDVVRGPLRRAGVLGVVGGLLAALTVGGGAVGESVPRLGLHPLWSDPDSLAHAQLTAYETSGRTDLADALRPLAQAPTATWFTGDAPRERARALTTAAAAAGELPVLVAYDVPGRDCGSFSAGGAADDDAYLAWVGELAAGIGDRPSVVVLEPDAVAFAVTGCSGVDRRERLGLLRRAVEVLAALPATHVYVDAGHAGWVQDLPALATALRAAGVDEAAGFALNVSNFQPTDVTVAYGRKLSRLLGGAHLVVDTSRNGAGAPVATGRDEDWCNPPGRRIGRLPSTLTGEDVVDAWLWVKRPGESDGSCRPGEPAAGEWFEGYALALVGV
ncbi:glycoside hydrolase family 6 protein [Kineococcus sp. DHX-1]|uniref:glycoside hydrolase family 6 protein n=1 Tax=Kineococcus sp. DHX-1 TaxID=3349638 RepID=UPI0036D36A25